MVDIVLLWSYLLSILQPCTIFHECRNHRWSREYVLNRHRSLHKCRHRNICPYVNNLFQLRNPTLPSISKSCSHRSLFHSLDGQKFVFALCQMSPWSSLWMSPWQLLPRPHSRYVRLTVTVWNVKCDWQNSDVTVAVTVIVAIVWLPPKER